MMNDIFFSWPATFDIHLSSNVTAGSKNCNNILFLVCWLCFFLFIFFISHDDVIGKITLAKDVIGSQAKGKARRLNTHHLPTTCQSSECFRRRAFF